MLSRYSGGVIRDPDPALVKARITGRLEELSHLGADWLDGEGKAVTKEALASAAHGLPRLADGHAGFNPRIYPTLDGGVQAEWDSDGRVRDVTFDPDGSLVVFDPPDLFDLMAVTHECSPPCDDMIHYCPCEDGVHDDCWWYYDGCCCHNRVPRAHEWDYCPPDGCAHHNAQHEGIPQRLVYVMNRQGEFGVDYPEY